MHGASIDGHIPQAALAAAYDRLPSWQRAVQTPTRPRLREALSASYGVGVTASDEGCRVPQP